MAKARKKMWTPALYNEEHNNRSLKERIEDQCEADEDEEHDEDVYYSSMANAVDELHVALRAQFRLENELNRIPEGAEERLSALCAKRIYQALRPFVRPLGLVCTIEEKVTIKP